MVKLEELAISQEQAREFARAIYADIGDYIEKHREEFETFLKQQAKNKEDKNEIISLK